MAHQSIQTTYELIINSTISHDGSEGRTAEEDIRLADFGKRFIIEPESSESSPSKPRSPSPPPRPLGTSQEGNRALQDYQMQLMLLEQQNKKRLMMARQEHDNIIAIPENQVVPVNGPVLRAPFSNSSISIVSNDGEEVVAAAQETQAHTRVMEDDKRLAGFCFLQEPDIEREARNGKRRRKITTQSVQSNQPMVAGRTEMVGDKPNPMITTVQEQTYCSAGPVAKRCKAINRDSKSCGFIKTSSCRYI
jgi:hypothetical protein